jgi:hypothetical protein
LKTKLKAAANPELNFERKWIVTLTDVGVSCKRPNGEIESVSWDDLKLVGIETTDEGPYLPDVFWYLVGEQGGCLVPLGATGENAMIERLQALPGFDNEALIEAMSSSSNRKFVCWQKNAAT